MTSVVNSFSKAITLLLSLFHAIMGEILFYIVYYNDMFLEELLYITALVLILLYLLPIVIFYKGRNLYSLFLIIIFTPIMTLVSMFVFAELFPIAEGDLGAGLLGIFLIGYNYLFIFLGTIIGVVIKIIIQQRNKLSKELNEG